MDAEKLKLVDSRTKHLVFGFIRIAQSKLLNENKIKIFLNIPPLISYICLLYYFIGDYFDVLGDSIELSKDKTVITKTESSGWSNSNYGKICIDSQSNAIFKWYLKLNKMMDSLCDAQIFIASDCKITKCPVTWNNYSTNYYGFYIGNGERYGYDKPYKGPYFGNKIFKQGDIVCFELNLKNDYIKVYRNDDDDLGILYKGINKGQDIKYRICVSLYYKGDQVEIIKCEYL